MFKFKRPFQNNIGSKSMTLDDFIYSPEKKLKDLIASNPTMNSPAKIELSTKVSDFFNSSFILLEPKVSFNLSNHYMYGLLKNPLLAVKLLREFSKSNYKLKATNRPHALHITNNNRIKGTIYPIHTSKSEFIIYTECVLSFAKLENRGRGVFYFNYVPSDKTRTNTKSKLYFGSENSFTNYLLQNLIRLGLKQYLEGIVHLFGTNARILASNFTTKTSNMLPYLKSGKTREIYSSQDIEYLENMFNKNIE